jgi:hypothetical protein
MDSDAGVAVVCTVSVPAVVATVDKVSSDIVSFHHSTQLYVDVVKHIQPFLGGSGELEYSIIPFPALSIASAYSYSLAASRFAVS